MFKMKLPISLFFICVFSFTLFATVYSHNTTKSTNTILYSNLTNSTHLHKGSKPFWEECAFESGNLGPLFTLLYFFLIIIIFIGLALVCDDYFVPSLEALSNMLNLSEDVAGATFMAAGSSAPELFTSLAATGVTSDVGIGTIVGSAVFNILVIISLSALLSGQKKAMQLDWKPLIRDSIFYAFSIIIFIIFSWDGLFAIYEAILMLLLYLTYIVIMCFNKWLMLGMAWCGNVLSELPLFCRRLKRSRNAVDAEGPVDTEENQERMQSVLNNVSKVGNSVAIQMKMSSTSISESMKEYKAKASNKRRFTHHSTNFFHSHETRAVIRRHGSHTSIIQSGRDSHIKHLHGHDVSHTGTPASLHMDVISVRTAGDVVVPQSPCEIIDNVDMTEDEIRENESEDDLESLPPIIEGPPSWKEAKENGAKGYFMFFFRWGLYIPSLPFSAIYAWTIPNSHYHREWYMVVGGFVMSIVWIAILSFLTVILVGRSGCILGINHFTMGLVIVASGTSIPDALSSLLVARDGYGDMAISNAIGSNIFDLDLGLGLPFLIGILLNRFQPIELYSLPEGIGSIPLLPHPKFGFILLLILIIIVISFTATKFKLRKVLGVCFMGMYFLFIAYAMIQEFVCNGILC